MNRADKVAVLNQVGFLSGLDAITLAELADQCAVKNYRAGARIVSELEFGTEVYIIARGQAEISIQPQVGERKILGEIGPGATFGEMASLTGALRSATVRAKTPIEALVLSDQDFDYLRVRRPETAASLVGILAARLAEAEHTLDELLSGKSRTPMNIARRTPRSTLALLWRELVVNREKDLTFLTLVAFVAALLCVRGAVFLSFAFDYAPRGVLRAAYVSGFALVILSACAALLTFRPRWRRLISIAFGIGAALIINELGVTLAFDIFYKDIYTPDPNLAFDVEKLYRRTEPIRAMVIALVLLVQAVYLKAFYFRMYNLVALRLARLLRGGKWTN